MATALTSPGAAGASSGGDGGAGGGGGGEAQGSAGFAGDPALDAGGAGADAGGADPAGGDPAGPQKPSLFNFAQRQWPNQERAEREFLTTIGRLQSAQRRTAELEALVEHYKTAGGGAPGNGAAQGETGADGEGEAGEQPLIDIDSLDWQLISTAMKERGPEVGLYLAMQAMANALGTGFDARMKTSLEPLNQLRTHATTSAQTARLWQGAADAVDGNGNLLFPELSDPKVGPIVFDIWNQITEGLPPEIANHPRMARTAILEYRALMAAQQSGAPAGPGGGNDAGGAGDGAVDPGAVAGGIVGAMRRGAASRGVLPAGAPQPPTPARRGKPMSEEDQIRASLLSEGQERSSLGFRR